MKIKNLNIIKQQGAALLIFMLVLVLGSVTLLLNSLRANAVQSAREQATNRALAQAKEALIGYAASYGDAHPGEVHGYLPCPDEGQNIAQDGEASSSCGAMDVSRLGKLPWRTLGLPPLKDGAGECLWYAVSGSSKNSPQTRMMNEDTAALFEVMAADGVSFLAGATPESRAVAVIFAPGRALGNQKRASLAQNPSCGGNNIASNYLDSDSTHLIDNSVISSIAATLSRFIAGPIKDPNASSQLTDTLVNDRLLVITQADIFNAIRRRADFRDLSRNPLLLMTKKAAECLADYGRNNAGATDYRLPWAAIASPAIDTDCNYSNGSASAKMMFGRLPNRVTGSRVATANKILSQSYPGCSASYYQFKSFPSISPANLNCHNVPDWDTYYPWWSNWKDHLFYAVSYDYRPAAASSNPLCANCLKVNGAGAYAGMVIFAGSKLASQSRASDAERVNFTNYLEGRNLVSTIPSTTTGVINFQSGASNAQFNDLLYCIKPDLSVAPC